LEKNEDLDFLVSPALQFNKSAGDCGRFLCFPLEYDRSDLERMLIHDQPWLTTGPTWRKPFLMKLGGWNEELPCLQDWDLNFRALAMGGRYARLAEVDSYWRRPGPVRSSIGSTNRGASEVAAVFKGILPMIEDAHRSKQFSAELAGAGVVNLLKMCRSRSSMKEGVRLLTKSPLYELLQEHGFRKADPWRLLTVRYGLYLRDSDGLRDRVFSHWPESWRFWRVGRRI
jgi:hypothetical protein